MKVGEIIETVVVPYFFSLFYLFVLFFRKCTFVSAFFCLNMISSLSTLININDVRSWLSLKRKLSFTELCTKYNIDVADSSNSYFWNLTNDTEIIITHDVLKWCGYAGEYSRMRQSFLFLLSKRSHMSYRQIQDIDNPKKWYAVVSTETFIELLMNMRSKKAYEIRCLLFKLKNAAVMYTQYEKLFEIFHNYSSTSDVPRPQSSNEHRRSVICFGSNFAENASTEFPFTNDDSNLPENRVEATLPPLIDSGITNNDESQCTTFSSNNSDEVSEARLPADAGVINKDGNQNNGNEVNDVICQEDAEVRIINSESPQSDQRADDARLNENNKLLSKPQQRPSLLRDVRTRRPNASEKNTRSEVLRISVNGRKLTSKKKNPCFALISLVPRRKWYTVCRQRNSLTKAVKNILASNSKARLVKQWMDVNCPQGINELLKHYFCGLVARHNTLFFNGHSDLDDGASNLSNSSSSDGYSDEELVCKIDTIFAKSDVSDLM